MNYKISIKNWGRMFTVPCCVVDDYIKLSSGNSIKVLLYLLCSNTDSFESSDISKKIGISINEIDDTIEYWCELGIIENINTNNQIVQKTNLEITSNNIQLIEAENPTKNSVIKKTTIKYTPKDIKEIVDKSDEMKFLMDDIQIILGKTISHTEQSALINMHEYYGYSASTILLIYDYCVKIGKTRISYVEKVVQNWAENDIITHEEVEREIIRKLEIHSFENTVKKAFGIDRKLTTKELGFIEVWTKWNFTSEMLDLVYEKCIDQTGKFSFPYINKILESWYMNKSFTPAQVEQNDIKNKKNINNSKQQENTEHSYDLDMLFRKSVKTNKIVQEVK